MRRRGVSTISSFLSSSAALPCAHTQIALYSTSPAESHILRDSHSCTKPARGRKTQLGANCSLCVYPASNSCCEAGVLLFEGDRHAIAHPATASQLVNFCAICRPWVYPADTPRNAARALQFEGDSRSMAPAATTNPLFKFGVDLDSVDPDTGRTALHRAAMFADADKVQLPPVLFLLDSKPRWCTV